MMSQAEKQKIEKDAQKGVHPDNAVITDEAKI